ncbi:hypothetical protein [Stakelama tenebrarum]|uniref:Uncharacterized protein n=1 Tax=Stakelama tenebrarum TaxID=2711215 RepID=A0A6G6Y166_9SPHN|nr:hypothetical protein [Sphingosinithalassobacter tenebrarum]QIG78684.1 hypothetical protein G5C33_02030 [Sphingosinithalassobacter tenebrarum]
MKNGRPPIPPEPPSEDAPFDAAFEPVPVRDRHDGWTPDKQTAFIEALAASGCVVHAAEAVGMRPNAAYRLRARPDAASFRAAWEHALEYAVQRLAEATLSRAIHGVSRPVYYQGEVIGERRYYDERLAMFILRYRDPYRYGAWVDDSVPSRTPDAEARGLTRAVDRLASDVWADHHDFPREKAPIDFPARQPITPEEQARREREAAERRDSCEFRVSEIQEAEEEAAREAAQATARDAGDPSDPGDWRNYVDDP